MLARKVWNGSSIERGFLGVRGWLLCNAKGGSRWTSGVIQQGSAYVRISQDSQEWNLHGQRQYISHGPRCWARTRGRAVTFTPCSCGFGSHIQCADPTPLSNRSMFPCARIPEGASCSRLWGPTSITLFLLFCSVQPGGTERRTPGKW